MLAGKGNNGGGGLVAARHLSNMGGNVRVFLTVPADDLVDVPGHQASILRKMGVELMSPESLSPESLRDTFAEADVTIDALIDYSLTGAPRGYAATLIKLANASGRQIVSLDVPSGVDVGSGTVYEPSIRATATLTLALPKTGLMKAGTRQRLGDLYLADLSVPPVLYRRLGLDVEPLFAHDDVIPIEWSEAGWTTLD